MLIIILVFGREMKETQKKYIIEKKNYCQFSRIVKPIIRNKCVERQKN